MSEMHRMLGVLRPGDATGDATGNAAEREPQPGVGDLPALVARTRATGLAATLAVEGDRRELPPGVELSAYRIVQEALTNVVRHAGASETADGVRVTLAGADGVAGINARLVRAGVAVFRLEHVHESLEHRFLEITSRLGDHR
jgi:signal transduction histidine kinase